jgi:hypothetical protein
MDLAAKRRRTGVNLTAYFLTEMDSVTEPSIEELIVKTAMRFKLKERGD